MVEQNACSTEAASFFAQQEQVPQKGILNVGIKELMILKNHTGTQQLKLDLEIGGIVVQALWTKDASQYLSEPMNRRVCALKIGNINTGLQGDFVCR